MRAIIETVELGRAASLLTAPREGESHGVLLFLTGSSWVWSSVLLLAVTGWAGGLLCSYTSLSPIRDGGLKREKVKDTFKEEQQKLYSKMIVGNHEDRSRS